MSCVPKALPNPTLLQLSSERQLSLYAKLAVSRL